MPLTVLQIINIAKISQYLAAQDVAKGSLFGNRITPDTPKILYMERKAVEWLYNLTPNLTEVKAIGYINVTDVGNDGDSIEVSINDPVLGLVSLGSYTKQSSDTDTAILAASIASALSSNTYGYTISSSTSQISIQARTGLGSEINGGSNIVVTITPVTLTIGMPYEGGFIGYLDGLGGGIIIYAPGAYTFGSWSSIANVTGATNSGYGQGQLNQDLIIANTPTSAALICEDFVSGGYSDWVLPTVDDLLNIYSNNGALAISGFLWSSTETDATFAVFVDFTTGGSNDFSKTSSRGILPIRYF